MEKYMNILPIALTILIELNFLQITTKNEVTTTVLACPTYLEKNQQKH